MEELVAISSGSSEIDSQIITEDLYQRFLKYLDASPKTIETYKKSLRQFFSWLSSKGISQPQRADIISYREELLLDHKPSTVQSYIVAVRLFFKWTSQEGIYPDVSDHVKGVKLDKSHKKDYLSSRQIKKVMETASGDSLEDLRDYAILAIMFTGALRTVEVSRANIGDLRTVGDQTVLFLQGKGHLEKADYIKVEPAVEDCIRAYLSARGETDPSAPLFSSLSNNSKGGRLSTRSISGLVKKAMVEAGYNSEKLTAHSTRHSAITLALLGGESVQDVQQFARHTNINTTMIYAHNLERINNQCEATIASAIF